MSAGRLSAAVLVGLSVLGIAGPGRNLAHQARVGAERPASLLVDFVVVQGDGAPVADLQPSEVEVRIEGRSRSVRALRRVVAAPAAEVAGDPTAVPAPYGTNESVTAGRRIALLVDEESFVAGREQLLRNAVEGLLAHFTPADVATVVALPFGGVKVPFTSDRAQIRKAMEGVAAQGLRGESGSELACRTRRFLESLDGFLTLEAGRPSPLTVVVFTAGLAAPRRDAPMALAPGMCELPVTHFQRISVLAGAARANFYLLQPADIGMRAAGWRESISGTDHLGSDNPLEGIEHLAGSTGAARLPLDATGTGSLLRVAKETGAYYVAELEPERDEIIGRSRQLSVRVTRSGVTVRARPEITFTERPARPAASRLAVAGLLAAPEPFTELPLRAAGFTVREASGRLRIGIVLETVDPEASLASVGAVLIGSDGRVAGRWIAADTTKRPILGAITAVPGMYRLRVAAVDTDGRAGVAEEAVDARLTSVGQLSLGSIILGVSREQGIVPKLEFGGEPIAIASFDIYGGTAGMALTATLELARSLGGPALVALPLALARADEGRVVATGSVPIGALPPGDYVVRGVIRLEDGSVGRIYRTLRKVAR